MSHRIVVTGVGAVSPLGHDLQAIASTLGSMPDGTGCGLRQPLNDTASLWSMTGLDTSRFLNNRLRRKLDLFSVYGIVAAGMALESSRLEASGSDAHSVGIYVGNCLGGWGFTEPELKALHTVGVASMGPYVATAWFPAALQGQISLTHGFKGQSKTFSSRDVAGLQAMLYGADAIRRGRVQVALCGASEDLSSPYMRAVLQRLLAAQRPAPAPFGAGRVSAFSDGAAFLVLESAAHARARGATVLAEITGFADCFCPGFDQAHTLLAQAQRQALTDTAGPTLVVQDGVFDGESELIAKARCEIGELSVAVNPRDALGFQFSVSGVMEAALVTQALHQRSLSPASLGAGAATGGDMFAGAVIQRLSSQGHISTLGLKSA